MTRRRNFSIFRPASKTNGYLGDTSPTESSDRLLSFDTSDDDSFDEDVGTAKFPSKRRRCCGTIVRTPNTSRFRNNFHSRVLQKFPFLIEMFYWIINYAFYRFTAIASQAIFAESGIWDVAQGHGIAVLETEHASWLSFLFPFRERDVQQWFMHGHQDALTVLNKAYALIHIPGTVG